MNEITYSSLSILIAATYLAFSGGNRRREPGTSLELVAFGPRRAPQPGGAGSTAPATGDLAGTRAGPCAPSPRARRALTGSHRRPLIPTLALCRTSRSRQRALTQVTSPQLPGPRPLRAWRAQALGDSASADAQGSGEGRRGRAGDWTGVLLGLDWKLNGETIPSSPALPPSLGHSILGHFDLFCAVPFFLLSLSCRRACCCVHRLHLATSG